MARERYLRDAGEETIHANVITADTTSDKAKNWWYYNKKKLLAAVLAAAFVVVFVCSIIFKVKPDYTIAIMSEATLDQGIISMMQEQLKAYGRDLNGDGQVIVQIQNYAVAGQSEDTAYDVQVQQAATVRFAADMTTGESMIWLHDEVGYYCMGEQDTLFIPISQGEEPLMLKWNEVKALEDMDFSSFQNEYITGDDMKKYMERLRVSFRKKEGSTIERDKKLYGYYDDSKEFLDNIISGTKVEQPQAPSN